MDKLLTRDEVVIKVGVDAPLPESEIALLHAYWRACNYLAVGMIVNWNWPH